MQNDQRIYATRAYVDSVSGGVEVNDLTAAVTWANVPDANITQTSVTQHQAALTITESQISDLGNYALASHNHSGVYAPVSHTHVEADITDLQNYALASHTHEGTTIDATGVTDGYVLTADGLGNAAWEAASGGGVAVADLTDTNITAAEINVLDVSLNEVGAGEYLRGVGGATPPAWGSLNIVDDTTPQLGADLDTNGFEVVLDNNTFLRGRANAGTERLLIGVTLGDDITLGDSNLDDIFVENPFHMKEVAAHAGTTGYGGWWVKSTANCQPWFSDDGNNQFPLGYARYRLYANQSDTVDHGYLNAAWYSDDASAYTLTLTTSGNTADVPPGTQITVWNEGSGTLTINEGTGVTLYLLDGSSVTDTAGGCTMAQGGYGTLIRKSATVWLIMGAGITA